MATAAFLATFLVAFLVCFLAAVFLTRLGAAFLVTLLAGADFLGADVFAIGKS